MTEVQQSVIRMLTAAAEMAETLAADPGAEWPTDLLAHMFAPVALFQTSVTTTLSGDNVSRDEVDRVVRESGEALKADLERHYIEVLTYMVPLFIGVARQASAAGPEFSLQDFLQRQALLLATEDEGGDR
jgi:hypothetical protein